MERQSMQHIPMAWSGAWRRLGLAATMAGTLLLGGCATYFGAEVTAYHQQEPALQGLSSASSLTRTRPTVLNTRPMPRWCANSCWRTA